VQHNIPLEGLDGQGRAMAQAIESCVHCGFCLPVCPTYKVLGEEMDSPRGRITLMKSVLEGELSAEESAPYIDRCLGCQGCVTACPSGVQYGDLITAYRAYAEARRSRPVMQRVQRALAQQTIPHPGRFRAAAALGRLARPSRDPAR
jgi:glycolate oxidase iron-sulfur subunit